MSEPRWQPGGTVVIQDVWKGQLWTARPMTVVADTDEYIALWMPKGTLWQGSTMPATRPRPEERSERVLTCLELCDWVLAERELGVPLLWYMHAGDSYATTLSWSESGKFTGCYVNIQEPIQRTALGFQTMDLMLDVVIRSDRSWSWKDEDEFDRALSRGILDNAKASFFRSQAHQAIDSLMQEKPPFCEPWLSWQPNLAWPLPVLPEDWERLG